jgi:hypothetical protein
VAGGVRNQRRVEPSVAGVALAACGLIAYLLASSGSPLRSGAGAPTADTERANRSAISARIRLPAPAFRVAAGAGSVWVLTRGPEAAVVRIDPASNRMVGDPTPLPVDPWDLTVGAGAV